MLRSMNLDVGTGMNLVHGITRRTARLAVEIVTHHKDTVIAETS